MKSKQAMTHFDPRPTNEPQIRNFMCTRNRVFKREKETFHCFIWVFLYMKENALLCLICSLCVIVTVKFYVFFMKTFMTFFLFK